MNRCLLLSLLLAAGCTDIQVSALTAPPPGKTALLDGDNLELQLSRGVAFAFECTASTSSYDGPCRGATASSSDEAVATVYASYLDTLAPAWNDRYAGPRERTAFVVVGLAEGTATIRVATSDGDVDVELTVAP